MIAEIFLILGGIVLFIVALLSMGTCETISKSSIIMFSIALIILIIGFALLGSNVLNITGFI
jgi:hypothetical protein